MDNTRYTYLLQLHNVYATLTQIHTIQNTQTTQSASNTINTIYTYININMIIQLNALINIKVLSLFFSRF